MKKAAIIFLTVFLSGGMLFSMDTKIKLKGIFFIPTEKAFRDVYGLSTTFAFEISFDIWKEIEAWIHLSPYAKKGEFTFTEEETKLRIFTFGAGLQYTHPIHKNIEMYGGLGLNYYSFEEESYYGVKSADVFGPALRGGGIWESFKGFITEIYFEYSYRKIKPGNIPVDIGGLKIGIAVGYKWIKNQ